MQTKYLTGYGVWKPAMRRFTKELNEALAQGWKPTKPVEPILHGLCKRKYMFIVELTREYATTNGN